MTLRLIGLMSVVLFISLSAFSFLLSRSEDAIMEEVTQTVSTAGAKTLEAFGRRSLQFVAYTGRPDATYEIQVKGDLDDETVREIEERLASVEQERSAAAAARRVQGKSVFMIKVAGLGDDLPPGVPPPGAPDWQGAAAAPDGVDTLILFSDGVVARAGQGEVKARIPVVRRVFETAAGEARIDLAISGQTVDEESREPVGGDGGNRPEGGGAPGARRAATYHEELTFDVPVHDYDRTFDAIRRRMLYLFLGVLVVGTVLSAGLARRFTRPVRELDRGLKQLSSGDLNVKVRVMGHDEMARLGLAFNDMTRRLRAGRERALEMTRKEKLSALGRLAAGVAHDVRNPLHSMNLTLQHLSETCTPDVEATRREFDRSLGVIRDEIHRLDRLVGNFLQFARSDRLARQPVDLGGLLDETGQLVTSEAERRCIAVVIEAEDGLAPIDANVESLRSALLNLVLNSFEAMPDGGTLTLRSLATATGARVEVVDTGVGIGQEDRERVFEFGYTTREGGHGLGLAMVHQIVAEEHGGHVGLESRPGEGTRIRLDFPRDPEGES